MKAIWNAWHAKYTLKKMVTLTMHKRKKDINNGIQRTVNFGNLWKQLKNNFVDLYMKIQKKKVKVNFNVQNLLKVILSFNKSFL